MTPAELNHWAAEFMVWNIIHRNPCESHDDCQRVIEKAIDRGVQAVVIFAKLISMYKLSAEGILLATAEQKLRAAYEACREMEKK